MSRSLLCAVALLSAVAVTPVMANDSPEASAAASDFTLSGNLSLASQYRYRGLMQTNNKPAVQGGFDVAHSSGLYFGNWNSNISWLGDSNSQVSAPIEMDFYGGYKGNLAPNVPFDLGLMQYYYPGDYPSGFTSPDTTELYAGVGYGPVMFKYSIAMTNLFGFANSKYSQYFDLSGNFDTGIWGLTVNAHVGHQTVRQVDDGAYTDWKLGLTKDFGQGLTVSLAYLDTDAERSVYTNSQGRYMGRATGLLSITKVF